MGKKFVYEVPPIIPIKNNEHKMSAYGFSTYLDGGFAILARQSQMENKTNDLLQKVGGEIIKRYDLQSMGMIRKPYNFIQNSWLLQFVQVPGNTCDLGLSDHNDFRSEAGWRRHLEYSAESKRGGELDLPILYGPHNVDSLNQAQALLALWVHWANVANSLLNKW